MVEPIDVDSGFLWRVLAPGEPSRARKRNKQNGQGEQRIASSAAADTRASHDGPECRAPAAARAYDSRMSLLGATILAGIATAVLAVGAIVTALLAYFAFRKQAREVAAIERQVADGQELARQQAELLKIQSGQLELQREQLADQRKASEG